MQKGWAKTNPLKSALGFWYVPKHLNAAADLRISRRDFERCRFINITVLILN